MKKIVVTGCAGFIGFHVARALKKRGDEVIGLDHFNAYYDVRLKRERAALLAKEGISVVEGDIQDRALMERVVVGGEATHLLHLAAQAGVRYSLSSPDTYIASNVDGFLSVLETCRKRQKIHLVFASSSSVYGLNEVTPFAEGDRTDMPANLYGATKKANEVMAHSYHHLFGFPITGLRYFTVYGPWGRPDMAYYQFTRKILAKEAIEVFNGGQMRRDFTYIDDIVAGTMAAIDREGGDFSLYNLGNHRPVELSTFIALLEERLGVAAIQKKLPFQRGEVLETFADIAKSQKELNFFPRVDLGEGLSRFVDWYRSYDH